jgi:molecular chaperone GrpE
MMKKKKKEEELAREPSPEAAAEVVGEEELSLDVEGELERLKAALVSEQRLSEENQNRFLKALADLDNYKKRSAREKALILEFANEDLLLEMLPVIDNLERALEHTDPSSDNLESLVKGMRLTIDTALAVFKKFGLKEIRAVGEKFDPSLHHAISHEDAEGVAPDMVVKEFQKGYMLKNKLIRPSTVMVSKEPDSKGAPVEDE